MRPIAFACIGVGWLLSSTVAWGQTSVATLAAFESSVDAGADICELPGNPVQSNNPSIQQSKKPPACSVNNGGCSPDATCSAKGNSKNVTCTCNAGFTGDGITCTDINECATNSGGCGVNATCTNTPGSRTCACNSGYTGNGITCTDIDECATNNGGCSADAYCGNTPGSRTCTCKIGYAGDGVTCTDINECFTNNGGCDANATCTNTPGSRTCACNSGYTGDGFTCSNNSSDQTLPHLTWVDVPANITAGTPFNVTASAMDDASGVKQITVGLTWWDWIHLPSPWSDSYGTGVFIASCSISSAAPHPLSLSSSCSLTVPSGTPTTTLTVWAGVEDGAGNVHYYDGFGDALYAGTNAARLTIQVTNDTADIGSPVVDSLTVPATVDVTTSAQIVSVSGNFHDTNNQVFEVRTRWVPTGTDQPSNPLYVPTGAIGDCILGGGYGSVGQGPPAGSLLTYTGRTCSIWFDPNDQYSPAVPGTTYDLWLWILDYAGNVSFYNTGKQTVVAAAN